MSVLSKISRKVGLGLRPDEFDGAGVEEWIEAQLLGDFPKRALRSISEPNPSIRDWPAELNFSIEDRVQRLVQLRDRYDELDNSELSDVDLNTGRAENARQTSVQRFDIYKYSHSGFYGGDHIKQRLAHFWLNHFTIGLKDTSGELIGDFFEHSIYARLDGSFEELLFEVTTHPAMLTYLDNIHNIGERSRVALNCDNSNCVVGLNDNLARELMELHTLSSTAGYEEQDIREAAKVLSGWGSIFDREFPNSVETFHRPWVPSQAEPGEKTVLGQTLPEGPDGLQQLTDFLANQPQTIQFISTKLAKHFIGQGASDEDIGAIRAAWSSSNGDLGQVHRAVIERAIASSQKRYLWPSTWLFQVVRMSGAHLIKGIDEIDRDLSGVMLRDPQRIWRELGNSFWSERQPNGFSDDRADWISTEHMERRLRFAELVHRAGTPELQAADIIEQHGFSDATKQLVDLGTTDTERFIILCCSPEFLEA